LRYRGGRVVIKVETPHFIYQFNSDTQASIWPSMNAEERPMNAMIAGLRFAD
jgi:hypothetical protein